MTTEKQISELSDIRAVPLLLVDRTGRMVNELQKSQLPKKKKNIKSNVSFNVINKMMKKL